MAFKNTSERYGTLSIALHWIMAVALIGMYWVGDYMVDLTYYDKLYHTLPYWHKSVGVILGLALLLRLAWMYSHTRPEPLATISAQNHALAKWGHMGLYALLVLLIISGYLISTTKGKGIEVFGLFEIAAWLPESTERGELAGKIHEWGAKAFILLVIVHASAALLHHFYWKDATLKRMLGR